MLPPTILTEAIAQVGAIMILAKPENREKLIFFMGIERVRYRRPVHPGDVVEIEAMVRRLRSRMGMLRGIARVDGKVVVEGTMTFALGPRSEGGQDGLTGWCSPAVKGEGKGRRENSERRRVNRIVLSLLPCPFSLVGVSSLRRRLRPHDPHADQHQRRRRGIRSVNGSPSNSTPSATAMIGLM